MSSAKPIKVLKINMKSTHFFSISSLTLNYCTSPQQFFWKRLIHPISFSIRHIPPISLCDELYHSTSDSALPKFLQRSYLPAAIPSQFLYPLLNLPKKYISNLNSLLFLRSKMIKLLLYNKPLQ